MIIYTCDLNSAHFTDGGHTHLCQQQCFLAPDPAETVVLWAMLYSGCH